MTKMSCIFFLIILLLSGCNTVSPEDINIYPIGYVPNESQNEWIILHGLSLTDENSRILEKLNSVQMTINGTDGTTVHLYYVKVIEFTKDFSFENLSHQKSIDLPIDIEQGDQYLVLYTVDEIPSKLHIEDIILGYNQDKRLILNID